MCEAVWAPQPVWTSFLIITITILIIIIITIIHSNNYQKLYTVLSCLGVLTFGTCCKILICLVCLVASLSCLLCNRCCLTVCIAVVVLCVLLSYVYLLHSVCIAFFFTLDAGLLARSQYSEGPATGHLDIGFS